MTDIVNAEERQFMRDQVSQVLHALNVARIKYAVWGAAASVYHGGQWLWKNQDYEIMIDDWFDGPFLQQAVNSITASCSSSWVYDRGFNEAAWAASQGDPLPYRRPVRRFKHNSHTSLGVLLIPSVDTAVVSMHHDDLENEEDVPIWIYPSLKNYVESSLRLWNHEGRNSALLEVADLVGARRLGERWASEVGLELSRERKRTRLDLPSEWEMWEELARMARTNSDHQRVNAMLAAR